MAKYKALVEWVTPDFGKGLKWVKLEATDDKDAEKKARAAANSLFNRIARKDSKGKPDTDLIRLVKIKDKSPLSFMDSFVFFIKFARGGGSHNTAAIQAKTESEAINKFKKTKWGNYKIIGIRKTGEAPVMGGEQKRPKIGDSVAFMDSVVRAFKDRVEILGTKNPLNKSYYQGKITYELIGKGKRIIKFVTTANNESDFKRQAEIHLQHKHYQGEYKLLGITEIKKADISPKRREIIER